MSEIRLYTSPAFSLPGLKHGFFGRTGGVSSGVFESLNCCAHGKEDPLENVLENRRRALQALDPKLTHLCLCTQVHGADVQTISTLPHPCFPGDGMVTNLTGAALGIQTADCVPVLFACTSSGVIGACHGGWKGAVAGIVGNTVEKMVKLGACQSTIHAVVGPCIAQASYEVSGDYYETFLMQSKENQRFFQVLPTGKHLFDLRAYVHQRLEAAGVSHISHVTYDTCADEKNFFSNRRKTLRKEKGFGGQISLIAKV